MESTAAADELCTQCQKLDLQISDFDPSRPVTDENGKPNERDVLLGTLSSIRSRRRCPLCTLCAHAGRTPGADTVCSARLICIPIATAQSTYFSWRLELHEEKWQAKFCTLLPLLSPSSPLSLGRRVGGKVETAARVRSWLADCDSHHEQCQLNSTATRGVGGILVVDVNRMCLVSLPRGRRYFAMSYVWGKHTSTGARKSNIEQLKRVGGLTRWQEPLPRTIRDAIWLTQTIGEDYLWVDLLCIVQDDAENKHTMIAAMDRIYQNACLTIVAAIGMHADSGLFESGKLLPKVVQSEYINKDLVLVPVRAYKMPGERGHWPLERRAWTDAIGHFCEHLQEQLLSRRQVIFTDGPAFFSCSEVAYREDLALETSAPEVQAEFASFAGRRSLFRKDANGAFGAVIDYIDCVEDYSIRRLSYASDIVKAFSGVGQVLGAKMRSPMFFGLPVRFFDWAILFGPVRFSPDVSERREGFPSWSWVGWNAIVSWDDVDGPTSSKDNASDNGPWYIASRSEVSWQYWSKRSRSFVSMRFEDQDPDFLDTSLSCPFDKAGKLRVTAQTVTMNLEIRNSEILITDSREKTAGRVRGILLNAASTSRSPMQGLHTLIILSQRVCRYKSLELPSTPDMLPSGSHDRFLIDIPDGYHASKHPEPWASRVLDVMVIEWKDGIAFRKGIGWIYKESIDFSYKPCEGTAQIILQ